jgi:sulfatase modifying factor 1
LVDTAGLDRSAVMHSDDSHNAVGSSLRLKRLLGGVTLLVFMGSFAVTLRSKRGEDPQLVTSDLYVPLDRLSDLAAALGDEPATPTRSGGVLPAPQIEVKPEPTCPAGMTEVAGEHCTKVDHYCDHFIGSPSRDRCAIYRKVAPCLGDVTHLHFCVDRYEFPNQPGIKPTVGLDWNQASDACKSVGKRLCSRNEWTLACEGHERLPYPYGWKRNSKACNIDRPYIMPDEVALSDKSTRAQEWTRLDQRVPSGSLPGCVSPFGVYDMTGNLDEWVSNPGGSTTLAPFVSALKGGYWGPVRDRCRPTTTDHNPWHTGYQIGLRCCTDFPGGTTSDVPADADLDSDDHPSPGSTQAGEGQASSATTNPLHRPSP